MLHTDAEADAERAADAPMKETTAAKTSAKNDSVAATEESKEVECTFTDESKEDTKAKKRRLRLKGWWRSTTTKSITAEDASDAQTSVPLDTDDNSDAQSKVDEKETILLFVLF